ncbi:DUF2691 family protein [Paenibacillus alvei]|uniref:DUF2691 family protein n=1 Tax=Paenibacillus alvei TaxID=44250 RepID=UPI002E149007
MNKNSKKRAASSYPISAFDVIKARKGRMDLIRGISFQIPNEYGRFLGDILKPFDIGEYNWRIGGEESYLIVDDKLGNDLFPGLINSLDGETLKSILEDNDYYLIFQDLKAFPKGTDTTDVKSYDEYMSSDCQLVLLVVDSAYITIYCKNERELENLYSNARNWGYTNLEYITDKNDMRTGLIVW